MTGDYSSEISSIINALTGKFARKDHSHSGGGGTITDEEWSNPTWNESYINVTTSTHLRLFRMGNLCTLKYYFATKTGGDIPTSYVNIVTNIPTAFQPKYSPHQEALLNTSGKRFLMTLDGSNLKVLTYESSAMAGTFTGSISYECKGDGVVPLLTCSANATAYVGDSLTISGVLSYNNTGISSASVKLYDGETLVDTLTSDSNGAVSKTVTASEGTHSYKLVFEGDATYSNAESSSVSVVVSKRTPTISLSATSSTIYVGDTPSVSGTLSVGSGASVKIYSGSTLLDTVTTGTNGAFSYTGSATSTSGSISYKAVYDGDSSYESVESSSVTITVSKKTPTITASASTSTPAIGATFTISGTLKDGNSNINGASITISLNGSTVATTTTSSGAFSATITAPSSTGSYTYAIAYGGDNKYVGVGETVSVTVGKATPTISLSAVSSSISIGDTPQVTGILSVGSGESVKIYQGATLLDTVTTGSGGAFSYTGSATSSAGTLTYKAVYDGNSEYTSVESSTVNITVNKLSTAITIASSSASVTIGDNFTLSGALTSNNTGLSGMSVKIYEDDTLLDTVTTGSNGAWSKTISSSGYSAGSVEYYVAFETTSTYSATGATAYVTFVAAPTVASVSLTGDKSIISAYDHESCTLTATVLDSSNNPVSGALVSFDIVSGGTVVSNIDTATTNSSGIATVSYSGQGTGDINIQASCSSILSQTYDIEDCFKANLSASHSFGTSDQKYKIYEIPVCNAYEITGKLKSTTNNRFTVCVKLNNTSDGNSLFRIGAYTTLEALIFDGSGAVIGNLYHQGSYTANTDIPFKMIYDNGTVKLYINDVLVNENTINYAPYNLMLHSYTYSKTVSVSDVKIKAL